MKRIFSGLLVALLLVSVVAAVSADAVLYGDVDGNGKINNRDLGRLQQHLNHYDVSIDSEAADVRPDGKLNNRDLGLLQQYLNHFDVTLGPEEPDPPDPPTPPDEPEVPSAALPEVGYDLDGRGRVFVDAISQEGSVVTVTFHNTSTKWMTEETSYVEYTCTDAEGNELTLDDKYFGILYFGMLEVGQSRTMTLTLPEGTTQLTFGTCRIVYWSQWA